jgi:hypothetical protein
MAWISPREHWSGLVAWISPKEHRVWTDGLDKSKGALDVD